VVFRSQDFVGASDSEPTPGYMCAGTGNCCTNSPARLCLCDFATTHNPPLVIDLVNNPSENFDLALPSSPETDEVIDRATVLRWERMRFFFFFFRPFVLNLFL
jgi:hypothetical protein